MNHTDELDALPCALVITDTDGKISLMNRVARTELLPEQSQAPVWIDELFPPAAKIFLQTHVWPMLRKTGQIKEYYLKINDSQGLPLSILVNVAGGVFADQPCYRWVLLPAFQRARFEQELLNARQQTQRYAQEVNIMKQQLHNILNAAADIAFILLDSSGVIQFSNTGASNLLGYSDKALLNENVALFLSHGQNTQAGLLRVQHYLQSVTQIPLGLERVAEFETTFMHASGSPIDVMVQLRPIVGESTLAPKQVLMLASDISKRKHLERIQSEFVATISHEFRTPLTSIMASLTLLNHRFADSLPDKAKRLVDLSLLNSQRLKYLVNDLLDFGKISSGTLEIALQSCALAPLLDNVVQQYLPDLQAKKQRLTVISSEEHVTVCTDPVRFAQVLANLLSNAIKFSPEGTKIVVTIAVEFTQVRLSVEDRGCGVKSAFVARLFTQFTQENSASNRQYEGSGLGLAICKGLVHAMGGEIGYQSAQPHGAIFWFTCLKG